MVLEVGAGAVEQRGPQGALDELAQRRVGPAQRGVLRQHVGHPRDVAEQVADTNLRPRPAGKLRQVPLGRIRERHLAALHQQHQGAGRDRLGDGGQQEDGIGLRLTEPLVQDHLAVPRHQDAGCLHPAALGLRFQQGGGAG